MKNNNSKRHHYIPKFLIKKFCDKGGLLYIYDKKKDIIHSNPRSPKSVLFENHRNTIKIDNQASSIIEDELFQILDDTSSKYIKELQTSEIKPSLFSDENLVQLQFFVINLFWRIPKTDYVVEDLINRAKITTDGIDPELLRNDVSWRKLKRIELYNETINQMSESITKPSGYYTKIVEFDEDIFVLGDYPFIFRNYLKKFTDLVEDDFYIALTSKRILSFSTKPMQSFTKSMSLTYNASIINESHNYVVSNNLKMLKGSVEFYKRLKGENHNHIAKFRLFKEEI
ncbi:MAG: DUF4238 domain-containing protein [Aequorivita antarctica]